MRGFISIAILTTTLAACGTDAKTTPDAAVSIDAPPSNVEALACAGGEAGPITTTDAVFAYSPNTLTISTGQVVKFVISSVHNVVPDPGNDVNLKVGFGETKCLKFKVAGDYKFHCGPHDFPGTITVTP